MKNTLKLLTCSAVIFTLLITAVSVSAAEPEKITVTDSWLSFDVWEGSGDVSVIIADNWIDTDEIPGATAYSEFEGLSMDEKNIDENCFTAADSENGTLITLKENYLKSFKDGCYHFNANFTFKLSFFILQRQSYFKKTQNKTKSSSFYQIKQSI